MITAIIGIDCATRPEKTGLALGEWNGRTIRLTATRTGTQGGGVCETVLQWIEGRQRVLLALDAPLGWPRPLADALVQHRAGESIRESADQLFSRATDRFVKKTWKRRPLEVGADLIARTALAALHLLDELRTRTTLPVPLAWSPDFSEPAAAVEVYPAGTLIACGLASSGYKKSGAVFARSPIVKALSQQMKIEADPSPMIRNAHLLDAAICVLAGADFLAGKACPPEADMDVVHEGWIWIRRPGPPILNRAKKSLNPVP